MKLRQISSVRQNRFGQGFEENAFRQCRPTGTANDLEQLRVVLLARKVGNCLFHFAEFPLEPLNLVSGCFRI